MLHPGSRKNHTSYFLIFGGRCTTHAAPHQLLSPEISGWSACWIHHWPNPCWWHPTISGIRTNMEYGSRAWYADEHQNSWLDVCPIQIWYSWYRFWPIMSARLLLKSLSLLFRERHLDYFKVPNLAELPSWFPLLGAHPNWLMVSTLLKKIHFHHS